MDSFHALFLMTGFLDFSGFLNWVLTQKDLIDLVQFFAKKFNYTFPPMKLNLCMRHVPRMFILLDQIFLFLSIRMSHWCHTIVYGAEFWISCKRPAFLSTFSRLQKIQNSAPSTILGRQCDIRIHFGRQSSRYVFFVLVTDCW